jgi:hypothetical protein
VQTAFAYSFQIPYQADGVTPAVIVTAVDAAGAITTKTYGVDYNITGVGGTGGGVVTMTTAPASGTYVTIQRNMFYVQPTAVANTSFYPHYVETGLDTLEMQIQQLATEAGRSVVVPPGEILSQLPSATKRASGYLAFDSTGQPTIASGIASVVPLPVNLGGTGATTQSGAQTALGVRGILTSNISFYYNQSTGNDSTGAGTVGSPWATFAKTLSYVRATYDLSSGYTVTINNTFSGVSTEPITVNGKLVGQTAVNQLAIVGNGTGVATLNPGATGNPINALNDGWFSISGFTVTNTVYTDHMTKAYLGGRIYIGAIAYGACVAGYFNEQAADGYILHTAAWSTTGNKGGIGVAEVGRGCIDHGFNSGTGQSWPLTIVGNPTFSVAAYNVGESSYIDLSGSMSVTGSFVGLPWLVAPTGELGQSNASKNTLQALTATAGQWYNDQLTQVVLANPLLGTTARATYTSDASGNPVRIIAVGALGEVVATPYSDVGVLVTNTGNAGMAVHAGSANYSSYWFGRAGAGGNTKGGMQYQHSIDSMVVITAGSNTGIFSRQGIGYVSGAGMGGAVAQATSKSTGVTLNTPTGTITMNNAALAATTSIAFTLTNSCIGANDVVMVSILSGATTLTYNVQVEASAAGSCRIMVRNYSAASQSDAIVLQFAIMRGAAS